MNFEAAQRYHEKLLETFEAVPRHKNNLAMWNKSKVIARLNRTFQGFLVEEASRLHETSVEVELELPPLPSDSDAPEPPVEVPSQVNEVFIPEWKPQLEQPENSEGDYD